MRPKLEALLVIVAVLVIVFLIGRVGRAQEPVSVEGLYVVEGVNPDGKPYSGTVEVVETGKTLHIRWTLEPNDAQIVGVGLRAGAHLVFSYIIQGRPGLIVYAMDGNGFVGTWTAGGSDTTWTETLKKMPADHPAPTAKPKVKPTGPVQQG